MRPMRYPPLLIAMFLTMLLKPFAQYFGWTYLGSGVLSLVIFLAAIYAFHHNRRIAACLIILGAVSSRSALYLKPDPSMD